MVESDFFAWPGEVDGLAMLKILARRVARFDWSQAPNDIAAILYETVIPPDERRQLGEYYTPDWLASAMVREVVTDPQGQCVLDPACGSGTFIAEVVTHFIDTAKATALDSEEVLEWLRFSVTGIDVHPVAVHLARAAWVLAAQPAIESAIEAGLAASVTVPVYLGDALQLRSRTGDMFAEHEVTVQVEDDPNTELVFPVSLVDRAETFDGLMGDIADAIENGDDPYLALEDHGITDHGERQTLKATIATLKGLHDEGRDPHLGLLHPQPSPPGRAGPPQGGRDSRQPALAQLQQDRQHSAPGRLRTSEQESQYGIWAGGKYATHQDVAGLFFTRCVDLYLKRRRHYRHGDAPQRACRPGQYSKWRTGKWLSRL